MAELRKLNEHGRAKFLEYISKSRGGETVTPPFDILTSDEYSEKLSVHIDIELRDFPDRLSYAKYLTEKLSAIPRKNLVGNSGIWDWISLMYIQKLHPEGSRWKETNRYYCSSDYSDWYRNLTAFAWDVYSIHGEYSRLFLKTRMDVHNDFSEQIGSRQDILPNKEFVKAVDALYWNQARERQKEGCTARDRETNQPMPGTLNRLTWVLRQFNITYDINGMSKDDILNLLPEEFNKWKP